MRARRYRCHHALVVDALLRRRGLNMLLCHATVTCLLLLRLLLCPGHHGPLNLVMLVMLLLLLLVLLVLMLLMLLVLLVLLLLLMVLLLLMLLLLMGPTCLAAHAVVLLAHHRGRRTQLLRRGGRHQRALMLAGDAHRLVLARRNDGLDGSGGGRG